VGPSITTKYPSTFEPPVFDRCQCRSGTCLHHKQIRHAQIVVIGCDQSHSLEQGNQHHSSVNIEKAVTSHASGLPLREISQIGYKLVLSSACLPSLYLASGFSGMTLRRDRQRASSAQTYIGAKTAAMRGASTARVLFQERHELPGLGGGKFFDANLTSVQRLLASASPRRGPNGHHRCS
jgi:hypothetical protein